MKKKRPVLKPQPIVKRRTRVQFEIRPNNRAFWINRKAWVDLWREGLEGTMTKFATKEAADKRYKKLSRELRKHCAVQGVRYLILPGEKT